MPNPPPIPPTRPLHPAELQHIDAALTALRRHFHERSDAHQSEHDLIAFAVPHFWPTAES